MDQIFSAREVSGNKNVFKYIINNADGIRIQINVWDKEIHRIEPLIILNEVSSFIVVINVIDFLNCFLVFILKFKICLLDYSY